MIRRIVNDFPKQQIITEELRRPFTELSQKNILVKGYQRTPRFESFEKRYEVYQVRALPSIWYSSTIDSVFLKAISQGQVAYARKF